MNDFTKEELITLKNGVEYLSDRTSLSLQYIDKCNTVVKKLIPMIDNYCEHEPSDKYPNKFKWQLCSKCGADYKIKNSPLPNDKGYIEADTEPA